MDFELTPEEKEYQQELREFLEKEVNPGVVAETESLKGLGPHGKELIRKMGERQLLAPSWPEIYGGRSLSHIAEGIMFEEMGYFQGPWPLDGLVIGHTLMRFGSEAQKDKYLTGIARGEIEFGLGYTEPEAGSDLASVQIRAVNKGDEYIINGQKTFNTETHYADYHWLLSRTDPEVPKHKGLSIFIVDVKSPGITVSPLYTSSGLRTNEVFYEDVHVPKDNLLGEENHGWEYAGSAIGFERILWIGDLKHRFDQLVDFLRDDDRYQNIVNEKPWILDELAEIKTQIHTAALLSYKAAAVYDEGTQLVYESSLSKLYASELRQHMFNIFMQILGHYGELTTDSKWSPLNGWVSQEYVDSCRWTIIGGSSEIQRYIMALRGLRLPRK